VDAVDTIDSVNLNDIRVNERGNGLRFIMKTANVAFIAGQSGVQGFECNVTMQRFLFGKIYVRHPAPSQTAQHEIVTELAS
jgi:hypothetical protein